MNKKNLLRLILFACLVTTGLFAGTTYLMDRESASIRNNRISADTAGIEAKEPSLTDNPYDNGSSGAEPTQNQESPGSSNNSAVSADMGLEDAYTGTVGSKAPGMASSEQSEETFSTSKGTAAAPQLILDSGNADYMSYIPEMVTDSQIKDALDISNPSIGLDAEAAILFDATTGKVLYYKNAVQPVFPASTAKLLTILTALKRCGLEEEVSVGDELTMIAADSSIAGLKQGQILTIENLLSAMLLPSGNDAAYVMGAYVGRKSLQNPDAAKEEAIAEFVQLMNAEAKLLGVKNSCFKTPDGYDATGQYTTAYDMGLIGMAAAKNDAILKVCKQSSIRTVLVSGEDITWDNTNKLMMQYSGQYYSHAIGLKTGTSTMAGNCLIGAAKDGDRMVVCAIMNSSPEGRWEDAIALLKYGLGN